MGQRMEEFRDRAEELVRDMLESGVSREDAQSVLMDAVVAEAEE